MDTISHGLWGYLVFRNKVGVKRFLVGTVIPDLPFLLGAILLFYEQKKIPDNMLIQVDTDHRIAMVGIPLHSLITWGLFALAAFFIAKKLVPLALGWGFHLALDVLTHTIDATPLFWPLSDQRFNGLISYWFPEHHSLFFNLTNAGLLSMAFLWIFWQKRRRNLPKSKL